MRQKPTRLPVVHARIVRDIGLGQPALRQVLEELHIRRDQNATGVAGPSDNGSFRDREHTRTGRVAAPCLLRSPARVCIRPQRKPTRLARLRLEPVDDLAASRLPNTGVGGDVASDTSSRCRMRHGWPMIHGCGCGTINRPAVIVICRPSNHSRHSRLTSLMVRRPCRWM
jgi:hypothetical protein